MYRLALVLVLSVTLAGCGGSSDGDSKSAAPTAASNGAAKVAGKGNRSSSKRSGRAKRERAKDAGRAKPEQQEAGAADKPQSPKEALEAAPADDVAMAIRQAARATLALYDLDLARVAVSGGGRSVTAFVTRGTACRAVARDEPVMAGNIRRAVPIVKSVAFEVAGTGEALGYYVLQCKRPEVPSGPGKVVLEREGVGGPIKTREFKIRGKRWAIEYENGSSFLAVLVISGRDGEAIEPIGSKKREVGRKVYDTGPGTYRLQIQGGGFWSVRVKDIR